MPLVEQIHRLNFQMVIHGVEALKTFTLTAHRREWLGYLFSSKADNLISDSSGLTEDEVAQMRRVAEELGTSHSEQAMKEQETGEFDYLRGMMEAAARQQAWSWTSAISICMVIQPRLKKSCGSVSKRLRLKRKIGHRQPAPESRRRRSSKRKGSSRRPRN